MQNKIVYKKPKDLKPHPLNKELYDFDNDDRSDLLTSLLKFYEKVGVPNKETLKIDKNGIIYSGERRYTECINDIKLSKASLKCEVIDHTFNSKLLKNTVYTENEIAMLDEYNEPGVIRPQHSWPVVLRKYDVVNNLNYKKTEKYFSAQERNKWCNEKCKFSTEHFKKMYEIYSKKRLDLISKVQSGEYSVHKAYKEACDIKETSDLKYDKKRINWINYFKKRPKSMKKVVNYANEMLRQFLKISINGRKIIQDDTHGHEQNMISTFMSNSYMSAMSLVLEEEGYKSFTPREEPGKPDVRIKCKSKKGYHPERIEIKVAQFKDNSSKTKVTAGIGAKRIVPHTFLLVTYDPKTYRQFVVLSDLTKKDWSSNKSSNKCEMSFATFAKNHFKKCVFFHGDAYLDKKNYFKINLDKVQLRGGI